MVEPARKLQQYEKKAVARPPRLKELAIDMYCGLYLERDQVDSYFRGFARSVPGFVNNDQFYAALRRLRVQCDEQESFSIFNYFKNL